MPMRQKRKTYRKKSSRPSMRKMNRSRALVPRNRFSSDIHYFKRWGQGNTWSGAVGLAPLLQAQTFNLNQIASVGDFQILFDQYSITKVVMRFFLKIDPSAQTAATASFPRLFYVVDRDTGTAPASIDELRQYGKCKCRVS